MKLVGLVILGLIASFAAAVFIAFLSSQILKATGYTIPEGGGDGTGVPTFLFAFIPLSFFMGSIIPGYFSYHEIETKWSLLLMVPALYFLPLLIFGTFVLGTFKDNSGRIDTGSLWLVIAITLCWYLASLGGVILGYKFREYLAKRWE